MDVSRRLVSVIIPCYNRSGVIGRAISSVLSQTYSMFELIIVDDASSDSDRLLEIVKKYDDPRIRIVQHGRNKGGAAARNSGVVAARGHFVAFLDSDDEWNSRKLELQLACMITLKGEICCFTQFDVRSSPKDLPKSKIWPSRPPASCESIGDYLFCRSGFLQTSAILLTRELAMKCPFNEELKRHQDYDLLLRLESLGCCFYMVEAPLVVVHWEDLYESGRGLDPALSIRFLAEYRKFLSPRARSGFANGQIVQRLLSSGRKLEGLRYAFLYVRPWHLRFNNIISFISNIVFGDARLAHGLVLLKRKVAHWG